MLKQIVKGSLILGLGSIIAKVLSVVYVPILSRSLGPDGLGLFNLALALTPWLIALSSFSFESVATKTIAEHAKTGKNVSPIIRDSILFSFLFGFIASVIYYLLAGVIAVSLFHDSSLVFYIQLSSPFIALSVVYSTITGVLRGLNKFKSFAAFEVARQAILVIVGATLLLGLQIGITGAIIAMVFAPLPLILVGLYCLRMHIFCRQKSPLRHLFVLGASISVLTFLSSILPSLDKIFLGINFSPEIVGFYGAALTIAAYSAFFTLPIRKTLFPYISGAFAEGDLVKTKAITESSIKYAVVILGMIFFVLVIFRQEAISILFGSDFFPAVDLVPLLLFTTLISTIGEILDVILVGIDRIKEMIVVQCISLAMGIVLFYFLVPLFGMYGAAASLILAKFFIFSGYFLVARKSISLSLGKTGKAVIALVLVFAATLAFNGDFLVKFAVLLFSLGLFAALLVVFGVFEKAELSEFFKKLMSPKETLLSFIK